MLGHPIFLFNCCWWRRWLIKSKADWWCGCWSLVLLVFGDCYLFTSLWSTIIVTVWLSCTYVCCVVCLLCWLSYVYVVVCVCAHDLCSHAACVVFECVSCVCIVHNLFGLWFNVLSVVSFHCLFSFHCWRCQRKCSRNLRVSSNHITWWTLEQ